MPPTTVQCSLELTEVEAWASIADKLLSDCSLYLVEKCAEPEARAAIASEAAASLLALSLATLKWSSAVASQTSNELQRQATLTQKMRRDEVELSMRLEAREKAMTSELEIKKEMAMSQRFAGEAALTEQAAELRQTVHELESRRNELVQTISTLQMDMDDRRARLQQQKSSIGEELRELETQRQTVMMQIDAQRVLLEQQKAKAEEFRQHGLLHMAAAAPPTAAQDASPISHANPNNVSVASSPRALRQEVGIAALQTVREQLRELRESNSPPGRSHQMNASSSMLNASRTSTSYSSSGAAGDTPSRPLAYTPSSPHGTNSQSSSAVMNPWKARLMKLQGDLRSLRADLGTPQA